MKTIQSILKPTIKINGCTDKTCKDCRFWDEDECKLFNKKTKECNDKAYQIKGSEGYFNDFARLKECIEAEVCKS